MNEVRIKVTMDDETGATREKMRAELATGGMEAGKDYAARAKSEIEKTKAELPVSAKDPIDEAWRAKIQADIKAVAKDAVNVPISPDTADFRERVARMLTETQAEVKQGITAEIADKDAFRLETEAMVKGLQEQVKLKIKAEADKAAAQAAGYATVDEMNKAMAQRAKSGTPGVGGGAAMGPLAIALLAGAPLLGTMIGGAIVSGLAVGLLGGVAAVAATNAKIREQLANFKGDLMTSAQSWGIEMSQPVTQGLGVIEAGFQQLKPAVGQVFGNLGPDVTIFSQSLVDLASSAMPGVQAASARMVPVFQGWDSTMKIVGKSMGDMFDTLTSDTPKMSSAFVLLGGTVSTLLGGLTPLVNDLTSMWVQIGGSVNATLSSLVNVIDGAVHGALPTFGGALKADLDVVNMLLTGLGPLSAVIGSLGGAAGAAAANFKLFSLAQGPISNAADALKKAGTEGTTFGSVTTKIGSGLSKVGDSLPYIGVGLALLGTAMDLDAAHANSLSDASDKLAASLEQGGAQAKQAQQQLADAKKANDGYLKSMQDLQAAQVQGTQTAGVYGNMAGSNATQIAGLSQQVQDNKTIADQALQKYNDWAAKMGLTAITAAQLSGKVDILASSTQSASSNSSQLKADIAALNTAAGNAQSKITALSDSLAILGDHGLQKAQDYAAQFGNALNTFSTQMDNAKGAVFNLNGELNTNSERGRDVLTVLEQAQQSWAGQAQSMADAGQSTAAINQALQGNQDQLIGVLKAAGLTMPQIQNLLQLYGLIPKDISTKVHADTSQAIDDTRNLLRWIGGQRAVVTVDTQTGNTTSLYFGGGRRASASGGVMSPMPGAASGMALPGGLRIVGEQGAELIRESAGATVVPRSGVDKVLTDAFGNSGGARSGPVTLEVRTSGDEFSQLLAMVIKKYVRIVGGGNVQNALGGFH